MSEKKLYNILDRAVISVTGPEASSFLQAIITNDIYKVSQTNSIYSCILTPQGKYAFDFFISYFEDKFFIEIDKLCAKQLISKLNLYKLRKNIEIKMEDEYEVLSLQELIDQEQAWLTLPFLSGLKYIDPRYSKMGYRAIIKSDSLPEILAAYNQTLNSYEYYRINNGIPEGNKDLRFEKSFPLEYGLDYLNAIDFKKGCYVGQEVTARTKYRGLIRKKIYVVKAINDISIDKEVYLNEIKVGNVTSVFGNIGLALIREEEYHNEKAKDQNIAPTIEGKEVSLITPIWQV
ncbi:MAG: YgfZ/GcvT domain-containing protein [Alphaproteobacteria bacterium]